MVGCEILRVLTLKSPCGVVFKERWSDTVQCNFIRFSPIIFSFCSCWGKKFNQSVVHCIWMVTWSHYMHHFVSRTVSLNQCLSRGGFHAAFHIETSGGVLDFKAKHSIEVFEKISVTIFWSHLFFFSFILKKNANVEARCQSLIEV